MPSKPIRGRTLTVDVPEWEPLLNLAPDHVVDFMWMGTVQLMDGTRLQVYKHYWTRNYLRLSEYGRAFVFVPKTRHEEVNPPEHCGLQLVHRHRNPAHSDVSQRVVFVGDDLEGVALEVKRRYVGRPSLGPAGHSPRVSFRVPPDLYKAAWARADKEGRSLSDLAREAFNRYMNS